MASREKSEDEILGIEESAADPNRSVVTDSSKVDDEDISCLDEDMLLLNSPPSPPRSSVLDVSAASGSSLTPVKVGHKPPVNVSVSSSHIHDLSDDDGLEIIEHDDVEEITDLDESISEIDDDSGDGDDDDDDEEEEDELNEISDESELESESEESTTFLDAKINIFYCHGAFFLWNAEDVQMLREECRIVGKLTGSLPRAPRQNSHLGLPLQLMPEEVKLLVDIDAAVVVEEERVTGETLKIREAAFQNVRETNFKIQQTLYKDSRKEDVKKRMDLIKAGKKAKKRTLKKACSPGKNVKGKKMKATEGEDVERKDEEVEQGNDSDDNLTVDDILLEAAETSEKHSLVQIFTENPWKRSFRPCKQWVFPTTEREVLRYQVFKDLWGKGFFLTSGVKFGGDFLVYPGDPARFHSHYIAICKSQAEELPCLDIITYGRQASNVRKTALLCSLDRNRKAFYTSLQWTGLS